MNKYLAIALLCVSAVSGQYIVTNIFADTAACSGVAYSSQANPANVCIASTATSTYYTYDANFPGNFTTVNYYTAKDCTGSFTSTITNFSVCSAFGGISYSYSAGLPKFNGLVSVNSATCGGAPVGSISSVNIGACIPSGASKSIKTVYYGGSQCVLQTFDSVADCSGTPDEQQGLGGARCSDSYTGTGKTTTGCQINGNFLQASTIGPNYGSNSQVVVTKYYNLRNDCTGQVQYTSYGRVASCSGEGSATAIVNNKVQTTFYDNYNCTGVTLGVQTDDIALGTCDKGTDDSSLSSLGSFPASVNSPVAVIQSTCGANPTIYGAYVYASGCVQIDSNSSQTVVCSTLANSSISLVTNTYGNTGCTGSVIETETDIQAPCESDDGIVGLSIRYACSATFSPSSPASTVAVAFSVMIMSLVAALLM